MINLCLIISPQMIGPIMVGLVKACTEEIAKLAAVAAAAAAAASSPTQPKLP